MSLRCWKKELETTLSDGNPLEDTALESLVDGNYSVSLKSLVNLTDPTGLGNYRNSNFEEMGITLNSLTTIVDLAPEYILSKWKEPSQVKTKNKLCKFYYRYVLDRGTDLTAHGMAVVVDNSSPGHCSLIADKDFTTSGEWNNIGPSKNILWPPKHPVDKEAWKDIVDEQNPDDQRIEYIAPDNYFYLAHPLLAAYFKLHDLKIEVHAEPLPLLSFEGKEDEQLLYNAALVLFNNNCELDLREAVRTLVSCGYDVTNLPNDQLQMLVQSLDCRLDIWKNSDIDDYDVDDLEVLEEAVEALNRFEV